MKSYLVFQQLNLIMDQVQYWNLKVNQSAELPRKLLVILDSIIHQSTMSPTLNLPEIIKVELTSFNSIGITSSGKIAVAPDLVVIDGFTGKVITDLDLKYELGSTEVDIRKILWNV